MAKTQDRRNKMNILLIVCDALRYDRVTDEYMPELSALSRKGARFTFCLSGGGNTLTSTPYLLCSQREYDPEKNLPTILRSAGYATGIIHSNLLLNKFSHGFDTSRDVYKEHSPLKVRARQVLKKVGLWQRTRGLRKKLLKGEITPYRRAEAIFTASIEWIESKTGPWFLWSHLMDTHIPYMPPDFDELSKDRIQYLNQKIQDSLFKAYEMKDDERRDIIRLYDEEARYMDSQIGDFIPKVLDGETTVIITSDHGDEFGEYKFYSHAPGKHGPTPQLLHVPLIFIGPTIKPRRIDDPVCHLDLAPTILDLAGVNTTLGYGRSLKPMLEGEA